MGTHQVRPEQPEQNRTDIAAGKSVVLEEKKLEPVETDGEILPTRWQDLAEARGIPDDQIFRSWRRFKGTTSFPYRADRWNAWVARERVGNGKGDD